MSHLRATVRFAAVCLVTAAMSALLIAGLVLTVFSGRARRRLRGLILRHWAKAMARLLNIKMTVNGTAPRAPFFLVANHLSYVDIIVLASQVDCCFVAKADVSRWPIIGLLCRGVGTLFIHRTNRRDLLRVNRQIDRRLAEGGGVVLFPEGTSSPGATVLPFKPGLLELAARANFAVSYAALGYRVVDRESPAHLSVCWWGEMAFFGHLAGLLRLREIAATLTFGGESIRGAERKRLADQLHAAVKQEFIAVIRSEEQWSVATR